MKIYRPTLFFLLILFLTACTAVPSQTLNNPTQTLTPPGNPTQILPQTTIPEMNKTSEDELAQLENNDEVVILLRSLDENRIDIIGVDANCFDDPENCEVKTVVHLPQNMPQILKIFWLEDGIHALFWDSDRGNIHKLNRFTGEIQLFKENAWKTQHDFFLSPDGLSVLYDLQKNDFENEIVLMDVNFGDTETQDINVDGMKRIVEWLNQDKFLFWTEIYSGQKGDLEDIKVYTFDTNTQELQTVELGVNWLLTTPPDYAPDMNTFIIASQDSIFFFDKDNNQTKAVNINKETYLWSPDSTRVAVYTQEKNILILKEDDSEEKQIFTVPEDAVLDDWCWLPGTDDLLLVLSKMDDGRTSLIKYSFSNDTITTINWSILSKANIVSLSYRTSHTDDK